MARHHLDDATLLRFASGDLDEAFAMVVSAHLAMCASCREALRVAEQVGGTLLDTQEETQLSANLFDSFMARLDDENAAIILPKNGAQANTEVGDILAPLQRLAGKQLDDISWKRIAPGIKTHVFDLASSPSSKLYLLSIEPGKVIPEHGHGGAEMTLVLSGAYKDELGRFEPGDIADLDEYVEHQPRVDSDKPCICLIAAEAPTRFKGLLSRVLQPLFGI